MQCVHKEARASVMSCVQHRSCENVCHHLGLVCTNEARVATINYTIYRLKITPFCKVVNKLAKSTRSLLKHKGAHYALLVQ